MAEKTYKVIARGDTYKIREDLKSWAFQWDGKRKVWTRDCVDESERRQWENSVEHGDWNGIELEFEEEPKDALDRALEDGTALGGKDG